MLGLAGISHAQRVKFCPRHSDSDHYGAQSDVAARGSRATSRQPQEYASTKLAAGADFGMAGRTGDGSAGAEIEA
jgi:hypothetical protein